MNKRKKMKKERKGLHVYAKGRACLFQVTIPGIRMGIGKEVLKAQRIPICHHPKALKGP